MSPARPTYVKVRREHLCPERLDAYEIPWEWDSVSIIDRHAVTGKTN